jgi:crossover junction endodeoxyribonuclease RuvC
VKILGIDPGVKGGLAIVEISDGAAPRLVDAIDIPVAGVGAKERVDPIAIRVWIEEHRPQYAYVERAHASSGFKYGRAVGAIEAAVACCAIPMTVVEPSVWKRLHRLPGKDKEAARQRALQLFPSALRCSRGRWTTGSQRLR